MIFKNPEILYALFALLIPVFIHLFQLQRFIKTPFTNVKFLKEIELQTRKSSKLKKRLILLSRMLVFTALVIAFAQPFFSKNNQTKEWKTIIYLDNSISLKAKNDRGELLKRGVQDIIENLPSKGSFALFTNNKVLTDLSREDLKQTLIQLNYSSQQPDYNSILIKIQQLEKSRPEYNYKILWFSDFQKDNSKSLPNFQHLNSNIVVLNSYINKNISIDSVNILENTPNYKILNVKITNQGPKADQVVLGLFQDNILMAKTNVSIPENNTIQTSIRVSGNVTHLKLILDYNDAFLFDNQYYISFQKFKKASVLLISEEPGFLNKIYTNDEFDVNNVPIKQVSYDFIDKSQLIVLNEIKEIPLNIVPKLLNFVENGGNITIIPNGESTLDQLNIFFKEMKIGQLTNKVLDTLLINEIHFDHTIFSHVFEKKVTNFQYPYATTFFDGSLNFAQPILSFQNSKAFISQINLGTGKLFWVASPLNKNQSNFYNSPLVVPIFYNMAMMSGFQNQLSYRLDHNQPILIDTKLNKDEVLTLSNDKENIIPMQQIFAENVAINIKNQVQKAGFYQVKQKDEVVQLLAFNEPKNESNLDFWKADEIINKHESVQNFKNIKGALSEVNDSQSEQSFFKIFVLLALLFILTEIALLKYL